MKIKTFFIQPLLLIVCILMSAGFSLAQRPHHYLGRTEQHQLSPRLQKFKSRINNRHQFFQPTPQVKQGNIAAKATGTQSRLTDFTSALHDGVQFIPESSYKFRWSGTHHPRADFVDRLLYLFNLENAGFIWYPKHALFTPAVIGFIDYDPLIQVRVITNAPTDSLKGYEWDNGASVYNEGLRFASTLDANGRVQRVVAWVPNGSTWEKAEKVDKTYDAQGNQTKEVWKSWDGAAWTNVVKYEYIYDGQDNMTDWSFWEWDNPSSAWEGVSKEIYTYDNQNRLTQRTRQEWGSGGSWANHDRYSYTYTGNNRTETVLQSWNTSTDQWDNEGKEAYTYNASGLRTEDLFSDWRGSSWAYDERYTYQYDASENLIKWIVEEWTGSAWEYEFQSVRDYTSGQLNSITGMEWTGSAMEEAIRTHFDHNSYGQVTLAVLEEWDGSQWASENGDGRITFSYEEYDDGTETGIQSVLNKNDFKIYPNPATNKITVQLQKGAINHIQITNAVGQVVFESKADIYAGKVTLPVSQLAPGMYYLQVQSGESKGVKSFVVK